MPWHASQSPDARKCSVLWCSKLALGLVHLLLAVSCSVKQSILHAAPHSSYRLPCLPSHSLYVRVSACVRRWGDTQSRMVAPTNKCTTKALISFARLSLNLLLVHAGLHDSNMQYTDPSFGTQGHVGLIIFVAKRLQHTSGKPHIIWRVLLQHFQPSNKLLLCSLDNQERHLQWQRLFVHATSCKHLAFVVQQFLPCQYKPQLRSVKHH